MATRHSYPDHDVMVERLLGHWDASDRSTGADWYRSVRRDVLEPIARESGLRMSAVAGIMAAMSPQVTFAENVRTTREIALTGWSHGLSANLEKARRIWAGYAPMDVLGGPKVRAFYSALCGNPDAVVLDTWMASAVDYPAPPAGRRYERLADALREAAAIAGIGPASFQAIVWTHVRGEEY